METSVNTFGDSMSKASQLDALWQQLRAVALAQESSPVPTGPVKVFEELWEPRNASNGVFGVVTSILQTATTRLSNLLPLAQLFKDLA